MPLRVLGRDNIALNTNTAAAIDYAVDHGAAVVNASIYGEHSPTRLRDAVARARAAGVLVVAAAGNEGNATPEFPAAFPETVSVAAATQAGTLASFSGRGTWVKVAAPDCAPVTVLGDGTLVACGTSVSTPLVAGVVALLRTRAPFASADELERALTQTARPVAGTQFGLVDAAAALNAIGSPRPRLLAGCRGRCVSQGRSSRRSRGSGREPASQRPTAGSAAPATRARPSPERRAGRTSQEPPTPARSSASSFPRPDWSRPHPRARLPLRCGREPCNDLPSSVGHASLHGYERAPVRGKARTSSLPSTGSAASAASATRSRSHLRTGCACAIAATG